MTDPPADDEIVFNGCRLSRNRRELLIEGAEARIGARAFDLLLALIERRDRLVGKDELLEIVWPGVVVEENNLVVQVSTLRKLLGHKVITTVAGRGYRFTMAIAEPASADPAEQSSAPANANANANPNAQAEADLPLPAKPSIAVLPFDNLGEDPEQTYFIDGVTEDIITELSRFRSLFVVARNSSFSYRDKAVDVRTIARQLGVRYVVEGSLRRAGNRIRVSAQLIDALSGGHVWAERYDRAVQDVFAVQTELARAIVTAVAPQIESVEFERARSVRPANLAAYELAMRARDVGRRADKEYGGRRHDDALQLAEQAIAIDAQCCSAWVALAYLRWRQVWAGMAEPHDEVLELGLTAARQAIAIDGADHTAHLWKAMLQIYAGQHQLGLADLRRAHELNPNDALTLSLLGQYEAAAGRAETGIRHVLDALRLSPRDALRWSFLNSLAWAHFEAADYAAATDAAVRSIDEAPGFFPPRLCLVLSQVGAGDTALAMADFHRLREMAPQAIDQRMGGKWNGSSAEAAARRTRFLRIAAGHEAAPAAPIDGTSVARSVLDLAAPVPGSGGLGGLGGRPGVAAMPLDKPGSDPG